MRTRRLITGPLLISLLVASMMATAQEPYHFFYGKVLDSKTKRGLSGVNLSVPGSRFGTVSDRKGAFSFFTDSIPAMLEVSHVGYETKAVLLDETSFSLTLYLQPAVTQLAEVEIKAQVLETFFRDEHYSVLDYDADSGLVWMVVYRQSLANARLVCRNFAGDTVAQSQPLRFRPQSLFRDCLGMLHVLSRDSGYQVLRRDSLLEMFHSVNLKKFDDVLRNCVSSTPEVLYFQKITDQGMGVEYYGVDRKTFVKSSIGKVEDRKRSKMLRRNTEDARMLANPLQPDGREDFVTWNFVHKVLYRPLKTALYRVGSYTCIFNIPDRQMEFYDEAGAFSYKLALKIAEIRDGRWTADILPDRATGKVYTTFLQNGTCTVYQINTETGVLKKRIALEHSYPQKIKISDGWIFYLYDVAGDADNKRLYRQRF